MTGRLVCLVGAAVLASTSAFAICPYDANCINNPYSGRDASSQPSSQGISPAPFGAGPGQYNPSFAVNPDQSNATYNPYAPPPSPDADVNAGEVPPLSKGLGVGLKPGTEFPEGCRHRSFGRRSAGTPTGDGPFASRRG